MKKNKRIFVFTYSDAYGGSESHILKFTQLLNCPFHWIILNRAEDSIRNKIVAQDLNVGYDNLNYKNFRSMIKILRSLNVIIDDQNKPLIYAVGFLPSLFSSVIKILKPSIQLITTRREMMPWKRWYHYPFLWLINFMSNKIETNSLYLEGKIKDELFTYSKVYYLPNIISKDAVVPSSVTNPFEDLYEYEVKIGLVANVRPPKNIPLFISIAEAILSKHKNVCFALVGRDSIDQKMRSMIDQNKLHPNFYYYSNIKHEEIGHFYKTIDIFLFTSLYEGSPNVIAEAMISELPIVSSNINAVEHLLHHNKGALLCSSHDLDSFVNSVEWLTNNRKIGKNFGIYNKNLIQEIQNNKIIKEILNKQFIFYE